MPVCEVCGNEDENAIVVTQGERSMTFDSFGCAIEAMAARCERCGQPIVGHRLEIDGHAFCSADCAAESGESGATDAAA
jgi:hypothetical protein